MRFSHNGVTKDGILISDEHFWGGTKIVSDNMILSYNLVKNEIIEIKDMLRDKINKDYMTAFKEKNTVAKNLLSVIKGEIQTIEKNVGSELSDEDVTKILQKSAKSLREMVASGSEQAKEELVIVESYLPKQMSKDEVIQKVTELVNSGITQMGAIMKEFAKLPADKKMVSEVVKEVLS